MGQMFSCERKKGMRKFFLTALVFLGLVLFFGSDGGKPVAADRRHVVHAQTITSNAILIRQDPSTRQITVLEIQDTGQGGAFLAVTNSPSTVTQVVTDKLYSGL